MKEVTGMMIYYYFVCKRKLWYFINEIQMEQNSELVALGSIVDEQSYKRERKGYLIDNTIHIDFIDNGTKLHEVKKTKAIEEAGIWQLKYYMLYLEQRGVKNIEAEIDYPLIRERREVILEEADREILENAIKNIKEMIANSKPPECKSDKKCKKCAYYDLCYI